MPSTSRTNLDTGLTAVQEILAGAPGAGRPRTTYQGAAAQGAVVLLCGALEGYVEGVFAEGVQLLWPGWVAAKRTAFLKTHTGNFQNAHEFNTNRLFAALGFPWIVDSIHWRGFSNAQCRTKLAKLFEARGQVVHGGALPRAIGVGTARQYRTFVRGYADAMDSQLSHFISTRVGTRPW